MGEYQACIGEYQACIGVPSMLYVLPRPLAAAMMPCPDRGALFFAWGIVFRDRCHQRTWNVSVHCSRSYSIGAWNSTLPVVPLRPSRRGRVDDGAPSETGLGGGLFGCLLTRQCFGVEAVTQSRSLRTLD